METLANELLPVMNSSFQENVLGMVIHAGIVAKIVLLALLVFSIISWGIMFQKVRSFRQARKESDDFLNVINKRGSLNNAYASSKLLKNSHIARVFTAGYLDIISIQKFRRDSQSTSEEKNTPSLNYEDLESLKRALNKSELREISRFEKSLHFLATTGSITPFIGLFGTVWGIMDAFRSIGFKGSASIGGVAPGISEALIATAAGLAAAIPAVIGYNHFNNKIKFFVSEMDEFTLEFLSMIERSIMRKR